MDIIQFIANGVEDFHSIFRVDNISEKAETWRKLSKKIVKIQFPVMLEMLEMPPPLLVFVPLSLCFLGISFGE